MFVKWDAINLRSSHGRVAGGRLDLQDVRRRHWKACISGTFPATGVQCSEFDAAGRAGGTLAVVDQIQAQPVPRPEWSALPRPGCNGVEVKVLLDGPSLGVALLRFGAQSTIDEHPAPHPVDVICLEGEGLFSVDGHAASLRAGERVQWPQHRPHRLWTEAAPMLTLMIEHLSERG